ncbi:conserved hypothetical protein [Talaromyces stipitatus ATCC 10500]|uniref:Uncharacterized protein n=1 Tax=Talaromyces stipitatus (strain ATCC 10500 / CBS 375.48 / QM 6759 / NRRL 1006) TaxID=441959 RepID=B8MI94_TALSN|nr:uncharacterized protein TSTA_040580 [Talaromyces stipitatus ATCC 10500]EED14578.1 conserved hypothetical protein [Talaromyces stipitatus ATCC 10500]
MTASLLTLDVKGAFDAMLPGRLIRRLREQGWPTNLVLWIASFATGRSVQIRLNGEISPSTEIACGLPQGSPGAAEGITFAPDKYKLLHFSRHKVDQDPTYTPSVKAGSITISENTKRLYLRWLGILFDKKLTFKWHVGETASKGLTVANALRSLGNTIRGVKPHLL